MIQTLRIENLAILDAAEIEFGPGLNVITGETGAGKSIVLGALGLLAGGRASAETLRADADSGLVEAIFRTDCHPELERELGERGFEPEPAEGDARELVCLQRVLHRGVDGGAELLHHGERREGSERRGGRRTRARTGARAREV